MKKLFRLCIVIIHFHFFQTNAQNQDFKQFSLLFESAEKIVGKSEYLASLYAAAGDKLYMVEHQDGTFPDLGWHVQGEMGGVWCHPI